MNIQVFDFKGNEVREITDRNGNPWFVAKDVSDVLGFTDAGQATRGLDEDEKTTLQIKQDGSNYKSMQVIVNESGLYSMVLRSYKPEAKAFKKWVTSEVLPAIRKTGGYLAPTVDFGDPDNVQRLLDQWKEDRRKLEEAKPKAELADQALRDSGKHYSITNAGKHLGMRRSEIFNILRRYRLINQDNLPSQRGLDYGVITLRSNMVDGKLREQAVMTMENIFEFQRRYAKEITA